MLSQSVTVGRRAGLSYAASTRGYIAAQAKPCNFLGGGCLPARINGGFENCSRLFSTDFLNKKKL